MTPALDRLFPMERYPAPEGGAVAVLTASDGVTLRAAIWHNGRADRDGGQGVSEKGTICLFPGRSEFIEKYFETIAELLDRGFSVIATDWRGQGGSARRLSNRLKGHVDHFSAYRRDIDAVLTHAAAHLPGPYYALAQSMGATAIVDGIANGEERFARGVLTAPMIGLHNVSLHGTGASAVRLLNFAGLGGMFLPGRQRHVASAFAPFEHNALTSDRARYDRNAAILRSNGVLAVGAPTISWTAAAFRQMRAMLRPDYGLAVRVPLLIVAPGHDTIVSSQAAEEFTSRLRGAECIAIAGARHEILMERDVYRAQFWAAFDRFIPGS